MSLNKQWTHIFKKCNIIKTIETTGFFELTAEKIKECKKDYDDKTNSQFEPRLLCYQTSEKERPLIFQENNIYMLPIKNGQYLLSKTNIYQPLNYDNSEPIIINGDNDSILNKIGLGETSVINNLRFAGLFESANYFNEPITHINPLFGRHRCSFNMKFGIGDKNIKIEGVQYEIDFTFESKNKIMIIECKNTDKELSNFNIRQLYYPELKLDKNYIKTSD